jgi:hypothetical protein
MLILRRCCQQQKTPHNVQLRLIRRMRVRMPHLRGFWECAAISAQ